MKKIVWSMLIMFALPLLFGCAKKDDHVIRLPEPNYKISIKDESFRDYYNLVSLKIPVISSYAGDTDKINEILKDYITNKYYEESLASEFDAYYNYEVTEVKLTLITRDFLSAVVLGHYASSSSSHLDYFSYSVNLLLDSCELYSFHDVVNDLESLKKTFLKGGFSFYYGDVKMIENISKEDMMIMYRDDYRIYPDIFFTEGYVGINVELPYIAGGYAGYVIRIQDLARILRENELTALLFDDVS